MASGSNLDINSIINLVSLGLRFGSALVERRSGKSLTSMSKSEIDAMIDEIQVGDERELFAQGQKNSAARNPKTVVSTPSPIELKNTAVGGDSAAASLSDPSYDPPTEFDEGAEINGED